MPFCCFSSLFSISHLLLPFIIHPPIHAFKSSLHSCLQCLASLHHSSYRVISAEFLDYLISVTHFKVSATHWPLTLLISLQSSPVTPFSPILTLSVSFTRSFLHLFTYWYVSRLHGKTSHSPWTHSFTPVVSLLTQMLSSRCLCVALASLLSQSIVGNSFH